MSFATWIATAFGKRRIWLYEITLGATTTRYVAGPSDVTELSQTWTASSIIHTRFKRTSVIGRAETTISLPQSDTFAQSFLDANFEESTVIIRQGFAEDPDDEFVVHFRGRVIGVKPALTRIHLLCENRFTELRSKGLSLVMQRPCQHALYHSKDGFGCQVDPDNFSTAANVTGVSGNVLTLSATTGQADGYFSGGLIKWSGEEQMIAKHAGTTITLLGKLNGLASSLAVTSPQAVTLHPGCDLTRATCNTRFNNLVNFGGFPYMTDTPFDGKMLY